MGYTFLIVGIIFMISGMRGTAGKLGSLLKEDFTGSGNFLYWLAAIFITGAIGYVPGAKNASRLFLLLVLLVFILSNNGVIAKFTAALNAPPTEAPAKSGGDDLTEAEKPSVDVDTGIKLPGFSDMLKTLGGSL